MDLTLVMESVIDTEEEVIRSMDMMYVKQQAIMEYSDELDLMGHYSCFQEGYANPASSKELDVFKFDNKHIIKAIRYFNEAYAEIPFENTNFDEVKIRQERGKLDLKNTLVPEIDYPPSLIKEVEKRFRDPGGKLEKGFKELQQQFDCKFKIYISRKASTGTIIMKFLKDPGKLTISKSKGFQLGGLGITININVEQLLTMVPANRKLFGQSLTSVLLHEIYHNIVNMIEVRNTNLHKDIRDTLGKMNEAKTSDSAKSLAVSFINKFTNTFSIKDGEIDKDRVKNRMYVLSRIKNNPSAVKKFEEDVKANRDKTSTDKEIDEYIRDMEAIKGIVILKRSMRIISAACCVLLAGLGFTFGSTLVTVSGIVGLAIMSLSMLKKKVLSLFGITPRIQEEYFCDLFASMYKLPVHLSSFNRQIQLNQKNAEKMRKLREIDQKIDKAVNDEHPITFDREVTSYKVAKQILDSGQKLKPEVKKYLQYIVNLHEGIDTIDNPYDKRQAKKLDPEAAKDLQKTLNDFINKTGATITESFFIGGDDYGS